MRSKSIHFTPAFELDLESLWAKFGVRFDSFTIVVTNMAAVMLTGLLTFSICVVCDLKIKARLEQRQFSQTRPNAKLRCRRKWAAVYLCSKVFVPFGSSETWFIEVGCFFQSTRFASGYIPCLLARFSGAGNRQLVIFTVKHFKAALLLEKCGGQGCFKIKFSMGTKTC